MQCLNKWALVAALIAWVGLSASAAEVVISDDGRQIQINGDGTWVQLSKDRYATNAAGERIRLKPDGTWSLLGDTAIADQGQTALTPLSAALESTLFLAKVEIQKRRIKRAQSTHAHVRTVYHLQVVNDSPADIFLDDTLESKLIAGNSSGTEYEVLSVTVPASTITPGERVTIEVVADGAPRWFGVKAMTLTVPAGTLGNRQPRVLSKIMSEVDRRDVDDF
ncbi:MAG: hypothetical protein ACFHXK_02075 [bacterium]